MNNDRQDRLRVAIIRAVARRQGYENPHTDRGSWWDQSCASILEVVLAEQRESEARLRGELGSV